jgi:multidrug resistance efflux pump
MVAPVGEMLAVIKKVVQILPQVRGRVIEVPAEGNRPMKKGDVLFKVDPTPYQLTVNQLEAQLATAIAGEKELQENRKAATAKVAEAAAGSSRRSGIKSPRRHPGRRRARRAGGQPCRRDHIPPGLTAAVSQNRDL